MGRLPVGDPLLDVGDVVLDVSVGDEDVLAAVEVVVEEEGPESQGEQAVPPDLRHRRLVDEETDSFVVIERDHLVREVADDEVGLAVAVVVGSVDAHGPAGGAVLGESDAGEHPGVLEPAVSEVPVEVVGLGVVRHRQVGEPVAVEVENRHPEALATRVEEAGRLGDVGEAFASVVSVERGACPVIGLRSAVALVDTVEGAKDVLLDGPLHVVEEEEVEVPVAVGVEPGGAAREAGMGDRRRLRGFPKNPVAGVFQQAVRPERGQIDVLVPVGVVVGDGRPDAVERGVEPRAGGRVLEGSVAAVPVERRGGFGSAAVSGPAPAVHEEEVLIAVAVGVEESHPAAHRLREVLLAEGSVLVDEADPGRLRHLDKVRLLRPGGAGERAEHCNQRRATHRASRPG